MNIRNLQNTFFLTLLVLTTLAFFGLIHALLYPIFWASVLATIFHPLYRWCDSQLGGQPNVASIITILLIILIVLLPLLLTGFAVATEASALYDSVVAGEMSPESLIQSLENIAPAATELLASAGIETKELQTQLSNAAVSTSRYLATEALAVGQNAIRATGMTFLMLYLLFFFLRDGAELLDQIVDAAPIGDVRERRLLKKFAEVSRATIKGTLVIGIVQGGLGGLIFWLLNINAAVLWGVVMGLLSLLPAVGAALVWAPAAIIFIFTGEWIKGILLLIFGTVIIGLADNVLRPILVGRDTKMPDYLILVSTLGGLTFFGISGVVIGPVLAALFLAVWDMFSEEYEEATSDGGLLSSAPASREEDAQRSARPSPQ